MQSEQKYPLPSQSEQPTPYNAAFIDTLVQRLTPILTRKIANPRTTLIGMSWITAMLSLLVLGFLTYLFLSMGAAGVSVGGIQVGASWNITQQLLGIGITSLAVVLVNAAFDVIVFRDK